MEAVEEAAVQDDGEGVLDGVKVEEDTNGEGVPDGVEVEEDGEGVLDEVEAVGGGEEEVVTTTLLQMILNMFHNVEFIFINIYNY